MSPTGRRTAAPAANEPDTHWDAQLKAAARHLSRHGNLARASEDTQRWLDQQIADLRSRTISRPRERALAAAGITATTANSVEQRQHRSLQTFLRELDWWAAKHGDALVPQMARARKVAGEPYWLGKRVSEYRIAYGRGQLKPEVITELEKRPGWAWRVKEDRWERMWEANLNAVKQHLAKHGTLSGLDRANHVWLLRQRQLAADGAMPEARLRRFQQEAPDALRPASAVDAFLHAIRTWLKSHPQKDTTAIRYGDVVEIDGQTYPLGKRATYYRRRYHGLEGRHPLTAEEVTAIEQLPGWPWQLRAHARRTDP